mmetsp:Transcript_3694/g.12912  ORF Transcript_3694/g.12912 Transcript_3694/m.12912 type:complete len:273 (-) Transcript_3694:904-1722(-)
MPACGSGKSRCTTSPEYETRTGRSPRSKAYVSAEPPGRVWGLAPPTRLALATSSSSNSLTSIAAAAAACRRRSSRCALAASCRRRAATSRRASTPCGGTLGSSFATPSPPWGTASPPTASPTASGASSSPPKAVRSHSLNSPNDRHPSPVLSASSRASCTSSGPMSGAPSQRTAPYTSGPPSCALSSESNDVNASQRVSPRDSSCVLTKYASARCLSSCHSLFAASARPSGVSPGLVLARRRAPTHEAKKRSRAALGAACSERSSARRPWRS